MKRNQVTITFAPEHVIVLQRLLEKYGLPDSPLGMEGAVKIAVRLAGQHLSEEKKPFKIRGL